VDGVQKGGETVKENPHEFVVGDEIHVRKDDSIFGKDNTPAIIMHNPKYPHNVGAAVRACSCFNSSLIIFTGDRVSLTPEGKKGYRLPREERMKGYKHVQLMNDNYPFNRFTRDVTPVAVEVRENSEMLPHFIHPPNPVYVFGPEDGSIPQIYLKHCQRFLVIPSPFCLNLAAAIYVVLYDRMSKILRGEVTTNAEETDWIQRNAFRKN
jgi:tRNA(Leu) C34 or U34 (ribose-2'-O)-methylase TrmL